VLDELASIRVKPSERSYFERLGKLDRRWQEIFADNCERHRRANRDVPAILRLATLPRQFQLHYNLLQLRDLRFFTQATLGRRIRGVLKPT
jgi:hypothetical protein